MPLTKRWAARLAEGSLTSRQLVEQHIERVRDPAGEGIRVFTRLNADAALAAADHMDVLRRYGVVPSPLAGLTVAIKDLFDIAGQTTTAGSVVLEDRPPAMVDSVAVARLRAAGLIVIGRTNMTEFAFSGVGINPHFGTPRNPWDRATGRIPGGSSSGSAVAVSDGMALFGLGSDTGGSVRIPAALCGLIGFKPTAARVPLQGTFPLSATLDSVGPIAASVDDCAMLDAILAGEAPILPPARSVAGLRLLVPQSYLLDGLDEPVARAFERAVARLAAAGARIAELAVPELDLIPALNAKGGFTAPEAGALHRALLAAQGHRYDPRVRSRIERGLSMSAVDYVELIGQRAALIERIGQIAAPYDAMLLPTVAVVAPPIADFEQDAEFTRLNMLILRNTSAINFLDGCALSLPCQDEGEAPVGVMLAGQRGQDRQILAIGRGIEATVRGW